MAMEHKAFIFDYALFEQELLPTIKRAIESGKKNELIDFIRKNVEKLKDPYEGDQLSEDWENMIENGDIDEYADFCLTKYYDPTQDIGLGNDWIVAQELFETYVPGSGNILLGMPIHVGDEYFDPGKMGSYFCSFEHLKEGLGTISELARSGLVGSREIDLIEGIYLKARGMNKGLYVTF